MGGADALAVPALGAAVDAESGALDGPVPCVADGDAGVAGAGFEGCCADCGCCGAAGCCGCCCWGREVAAAARNRGSASARSAGRARCVAWRIIYLSTEKNAAVTGSCASSKCAWARANTCMDAGAARAVAEEKARPVMAAGCIRASCIRGSTRPTIRPGHRWGPPWKSSACRRRPEGVRK